MGQFFSYSILSGLLMLAMYLAYHIILARENQPGYNRAVLLLIYAVSFITLPLLKVAQNMPHSTPHQTLSVAEIDVVETTVASSPEAHWSTILLWLFIIGMIMVALRTAITWVRLIGVIRSGERISKEGYSLIITDNERLAPFSWMRFIVMSH